MLVATAHRTTLHLKESAPLCKEMSRPSASTQSTHALQSAVAVTRLDLRGNVATRMILAMTRDKVEMPLLIPRHTTTKLRYVDSTTLLCSRQVRLISN